ncbi:MAG: hypothetical protein U5N86_01180 [Planctomycetota bacterium]|nr:hypothetical protein [Planctomycetota bacterium]
MFEDLKERYGKMGSLGIAIVVVLGAGLFGLNSFVLAGEMIESDSVRVGESVQWELDPANGKHTLKLYTYSSKKTSVKVVVTGPDGDEIYNHRELSAHKGSRYFNFTPEIKGKHTISIERGGIGLGSTRRTCTLKLYINDKRIFKWL